MKPRDCKHGFNPIDGPGLWCPACEEEQLEKQVRPSLWQRVLRWFGWWP